MRELGWIVFGLGIVTGFAALIEPDDYNGNHGAKRLAVGVLVIFICGCALIQCTGGFPK